MAVQVYDPNRITAIELGWALKDAGYDVEKIEDLGHTLNVDLLEILAGWAPTLIQVLAAPPLKRKPWWKYLLWMN